MPEVTVKVNFDSADKPKWNPIKATNQTEKKKKRKRNNGGFNSGFRTNEMSQSIFTYPIHYVLVLIHMNSTFLRLKFPNFVIDLIQNSVALKISYTDHTSKVQRTHIRMKEVLKKF